MRRTLHGLAILMAALGLLALTGCGKTAPTRSYALSYETDNAAAGQSTTAREGIAIGVGPVEFPGYLDRPQVVTRSSANKLELAEFDHWGGRLKDDFTRVLAEHLSSALSTDRVSVHPWRASVPVDYQITIRVTAFENDQVGDSLFDARWNVIDADTEKALLMARSSYREETRAGDHAPGAAASYESIAAAMSRNIVSLGREITAKIESLTAQ